MKRSALAAAAIALAMSAAQAEVITGRIGAIDDTGHRITLSDGRTYTLARVPAASYFASFNDNLRVGERVRLFEEGGIVTGISAE